MIPFFRKLIIISNILYLLWFLLPYYDQKFHSIKVQALLEANSFGASKYYLKFATEISYLYIVLFLISAIGLYFFIKQARFLFFVLTVTSLILPLYSGVSVQSPIDMALYNFILMADGVILYMSYFSSVASKFNST